VAPARIIRRHAQLPQVMQRRKVRDGVQILRSLVANSAFVWGCVDATPKAGKQARNNRGAAAACTVMTDQALRSAVIHLRQAVPAGMDISDAHAQYLKALKQVFAAAGPSGGEAELHTMVLKHLPAQLSDRYVQAVCKIRAYLGESRSRALPTMPPVAHTCCRNAVLMCTEHGTLIICTMFPWHCRRHAIMDLNHGAACRRWPSR
jgi:hypothetical protein